MKNFRHLFCILIFNCLFTTLEIYSQVLVKDIASGALASSPMYLTNVNGIVYFQAWDALNGKELWKSDGTATGTVLVKDIKPGAGDSNPSDLTDVNGTLFFSADDGTNGIELWKSDGTAAGTVLVKDIYQGSTSSLFNNLYTYFTNVNGILYFTADDGINGMELWKSDGTAAGTLMVKDIVSGSTGSNPREKINVNGTLYFTDNDYSLWKSDGTVAGTVIVDPGSSGPSNNGNGDYFLTNVNDTLYFIADDGTFLYGRELWKTDGTSAGTVMVKDIVPGSNSANPTNLTNVNGTLYFTADNGANGSELWKSDGTSTGTAMVKDIYPGSFGSFNNPVTDFTGINSTVYFSATDGINGYEFWKSDGTSSGTIMVKDILAGSGSSMSGLFPYYTDVNGILYFNAVGPAGNELWRSDGTTSGTMMLNEINPGNGQSDPSFLTDVAGILFFSADDGTNGMELWKYDPSITTGISIISSKKLKDVIYPNPTTGKFTINMDEKNYTNCEIEIYNMLGEKVTNSLIQQSDNTTIDASSLPNGVYFFRLKTIGESFIKKLIIQK